MDSEFIIAHINSAVRSWLCIKVSRIRIFNLRYVNMCLDVSSEGEGKIVKMTLDGVEVKKIFWNLQGHHKVKLICRKED